MQSILDKLAEWLKELLISGILGNLSGMFDTVNTKVGEIAGEVGMTPSAWNGGVFNLIRSLSETVIIPIAGIILTFVMCYELIQLVIEKNNLHDVDTWIFFKWIFKTFVAVFLVTNTWNIVMAIFDVAQNVVSQSGGIISGSTSIDLSTAIPDMEAQLEAMDLGPLRASFRAVVPEHGGGAHHEYPLHLYLPGGLWPYDRDLSCNLRGAYPLCYHEQPGMVQRGAELLKVSDCFRFPGVSHYDMRWHLCGPHPGDFHRRQHIRCHLGLHGIHGPLMLYPL